MDVRNVEFTTNFHELLGGKINYSDEDKEIDIWETDPGNSRYPFPLCYILEGGLTSIAQVCLVCCKEGTLQESTFQISRQCSQ